jgi:hypothetical protein
VSHTDPAILALRALGEPAGTSRDDRHLAQCADCQEELGRLSQVVELARQDGPAVLDEPPPGLWEQIAAAVEDDRIGPGRAAAAGPEKAATAIAPRRRPGAGSPPVPEDRPAPGSRPALGTRPAPGRARRRRPRVAVAVAALAAGLIAGIGGTVAVARLTTAPATRVVADIALRPLPQFPQWHGSAGTARLQDDGKVQLLAVTLTAPRPSGFYEVWLLGRDGTSMISLGDLNAAQAGTFDLPAGVNLGFYSRIDVSLQPFNGSTLHSRTSVVRGSLPAAAR